MVQRLGKRLPQFTEEEIKLVHGSSEVRSRLLTFEFVQSIELTVHSYLVLWMQHLVSSPQSSDRVQTTTFVKQNWFAFSTTNTIIAGGEDEFNGNAILSFKNPDGAEGEMGVESQEAWLRDIPWGLRALLNYLWKRYQLPIYMTENVSFSIRTMSR